MARVWSPVPPRPPMERDALDDRFMRDALALGRRNLGATWPNPSVGAVLVRETPEGPMIVGRGVTAPGGRPHGEAIAFERAGLAAVGATLYVGLEPCAHRTVRGATPCVERAILAGVARIVSAMPDPNHEIAGLGHALARSAGITVTVGVRGAEAARDHRGHVLRVTQGRPLVTLKLARTADGVAGVPGRRLLITGEAANARVHLMRAAHDAVLVGIGTLLADDPRLDVRLPGLEAHSPIRVVMDSRLRLSPESRLAMSARERPLWIVAAEDAPVEPEHRLVALGAEVMRVARDAAGRADPRAALRLLATRGITRVFCEGGPTLADALAAADLIDDCILITSPDAAPAGARGLATPGPDLAAALERPGAFALHAEEKAGRDRITINERRRGCSPAS